MLVGSGKIINISKILLRASIFAFIFRVRAIQFPLKKDNGNLTLNSMQESLSRK